MALEVSYLGSGIEVACDEVGRGCLAGPVYAAAVILDPKNSHPELDDSKKIGPAKREELKSWIEENALDFAVASVSNQEIDEVNILRASFLAMHRAIDQLKKPFDHLVIDGNRFNPYPGKAHHCIIKGDAKYQNIAAASILAKYYRDRFMSDLALQYPSYGWETNFGYPTLQHRQAIEKEGLTPFHRKTFRSKSTQLSLYS